MIKKKDLEAIIYCIMLVIIIGLPVMKLIAYALSYLRVISNSYILNNVYLLWIVIPILTITYLIGILTRKFKFTYTDYIMYFLIILAIISTIFAVDTTKAIFGAKYRYEGLLSILNYYLIFLNIKNLSIKKYKTKIIDILLIVGVFQVIYGLLQVFTKMPFLVRFSESYMATGICGNPNFFGSYLVIVLMISVGYYLSEKKLKYLFFSIFLFIGLCIAESTGPFLGFLLAFIFGIICFRKRTNIKTILILVISFAITFFITDITTKYIHTTLFNSTIDSRYTISTEITQTINKINSNDMSDFGNSRFTVWKNSLPLMKKYWVIGAGLDNFGEVYPKLNRYIYFDKAHNVYIQMAVTNGSIVLWLYCLICLIAFIKGFKYKDSFHISIYLAFVGYCIQAFANISVIDVAPIFFMILGLLYAKDNKEQIEE